MRLAPIPEQVLPKRRVFVPSDFDSVIQHIPEGCALVGGQAVAWWQQQYCASDTPITSGDIDFWGYREDLETSLVLAKLHAVRAFDQEGRQDELHLKTSLVTANGFMTQLLGDGQVRQVLWNIERLIAASQYKPYRRLEEQRGFRILSAVPLQRIQESVQNKSLPENDRNRLHNFQSVRWPQVERRIAT